MTAEKTIGMEPHALTVSNRQFGNNSIALAILAFGALIYRILTEPTLRDVGFVWWAVPLGTGWLYMGIDSRTERTIEIMSDSITFSRGETVFFDLRWSELRSIATGRRSSRYDNILFTRQDGEKFELNVLRVDFDTLRSLFREIVTGVRKHYPHIKIEDYAGWMGERKGFRFLK